MKPHTDSGSGHASSHDRLELRSEKVRRMLGEKPSPWLRYGTALVVLLIFAAIVAIAIIPYPHGNGESILTHFF